MESKTSNRVKTETVTISVADGTEMQMHSAFPEGKEKAPGLMLFQEMFGVNKHIKDLVELFAREGFVTVAPELYHRTAPPGFGTEYDAESRAKANAHREALTLDQLRDDIRAVHAWLLENDRVDANKIGSIGYCMGGKVSFLASETVELKAAVSYYGGGIAKDLLGDIENIHAPLLLVWGGADANIPRADRTKILEALDGARKRYANIEFSDAGHGFACDERESYHKEATEYAQMLSLSFLGTHL